MALCHESAIFKKDEFTLVSWKTFIFYFSVLKKNNLPSTFMIMLLWPLCTNFLFDSVISLIDNIWLAKIWQLFNILDITLSYVTICLMRQYLLSICRQVNNQIVIAGFNRNFRQRPRKRWNWSTHWNNRVLICTTQSQWLTCLISLQTRRWRKRPVTSLYAGQKAVFFVVFLYNMYLVIWVLLTAHRCLYYIP